ncbi:hypothetical protein ABZU75_34225 [Streptosporangium sp. NPDC005286]|uniref:hypothetical protein n=1 Tax=Streptosporangium sp. NPDC005286 TaxID=3154463 RepID=UPI0033A47C70
MISISVSVIRSNTLPAKLDRGNKKVHNSVSRAGKGTSLRGARQPDPEPPDPQVHERATARRYSAAYKARILQEYEQLDKTRQVIEVQGKLFALLDQLATGSENSTARGER